MENNKECVSQLNQAESKQLNDCDFPLARRRLHFLKTGKLSDCTFIVGEELDDAEKDSNANNNDSNSTQLFRCHKMILATASEVFERMFYGNSTNQPDLIKVVDITPNMFELFLAYIYSNEIGPVHVNMKNFGQLMYMGNKYMQHDFIARCIEILKKKDISSGDVFPLFELSCVYDNLALTLLVFEELKVNAKDILDCHLHKLNVNYMKRLCVLLKQLPESSLKPEDAITALAKYAVHHNLHKCESSEEMIKLVGAVYVLNHMYVHSPSYEYTTGNYINIVIFGKNIQKLSYSRSGALCSALVQKRAL